MQASKIFYCFRLFSSFEASTIESPTHIILTHYVTYNLKNNYTYIIIKVCPNCQQKITFVKILSPSFTMYMYFNYDKILFRNLHIYIYIEFVHHVVDRR